MGCNILLPSLYLLCCFNVHFAQTMTAVQGNTVTFNNDIESPRERDTFAAEAKVDNGVTTTLQLFSDAIAAPENSSASTDATLKQNKTEEQYHFSVSTPTTDLTTKFYDTKTVVTVGPGEFVINVSSCLSGHVYAIESNQAKLTVLSGVAGFLGVLSCEWVVNLHSEHSATINLVEKEMAENDTCEMTLNLCSGEFPCQDVDACVGPWKSRVVRSNQIRFRLNISDKSSVTSLTLHVTSVASQHTKTQELDIAYTSPKSGYVTSPGFGILDKYPSYVDTSFILTLPPDQVLMVSFSHFHLEREYDGYCMFDKLTLYVITEEGDESSVWKKCGSKHLPAQIYNTSIRLHFYSEVAVEESGFKMAFSILPKFQEPQRLDSGTFNCSVPYFQTFRQHLECNLETECNGKEDELHCPYKSSACGPDLISAGNTCYTYLALTKDINWYEALAQCKDLGQTLVSLNTPQEWEKFTEVMQYGKLSTAVYVGLRTSQVPLAAVPAVYREVWQWVDNTMAYYINMTEETLSVPSCTYYLPEVKGVLKAASCLALEASHVVCEPVNKKRPEETVVLPLKYNTFSGSNDQTDAVSSWGTNLTIMQCPEGHATYDFLSCDPGTRCGIDKFPTSCVTEEEVAQSTSITPEAVVTPMYACEGTSQTLHYTFVCDYRDDCSDGSDEDFCMYKECLADQCANLQCISKEQRCDGMQHCTDGSDENCHPAVSRTVPSVYPPAVVYLDGYGRYSQISITHSNMLQMNTSNDDASQVTITGIKATRFHSSTVCPETHFRCPNSYCLPVFVLCNGVYDCPGREDESDCDSYTCSGFYRCRDSTVCLHKSHVCDGVFQCPFQDDELLCDLQCPEGCGCQGLAFVCSRPFPTGSYPKLRYLDGKGSGMVPADLVHNVQLVRLRLSDSEITALTSMELPNLRMLDLSRNRLTSVNMEVFLGLQNLRSLDLSDNPIVTVHRAIAYNSLPHLYHVDLSRTEIAAFEKEMLTNAPNLRLLNLSSGGLATIRPDGFGSILDMEVLDLRGNPIKDFPSDTLHGLSSLKLVYADNFKFCCQASLPKHFNSKDCYAEIDYIASCEDLLRSDVYRACLWVFAALAFLGNTGSFIARMRLQSKSGGGFPIFVTNLCVADFFMGMYLIIIGVADKAYRGTYLWHDTEWKNSTACKVAGFMSLLSNEVSAFIICLITLDRFLALRFPLHDLALGKRSAILVCVIAWVVGITLASIPLLPMTSHWEFYSQTGICIPLPVTPNNFKGHDYSFGVMVVFNFVLFLVIAVGQVFIYLSVRSNTLLSSNKASVDIAVARRLTTVVLSDFFCWFPIGVLGILASTGTLIPGEVNVGMAIFVLPFNSALNPFLYTFNVVMEKRRRAAEARLLKRLECHTEVSVSVPYWRKVQGKVYSKESALEQIDEWIAECLVSASEIVTRYAFCPQKDDFNSKM